MLKRLKCGDVHLVKLADHGLVAGQLIARTEDNGWVAYKVVTGHGEFVVRKHDIDRRLYKESEIPRFKLERRINFSYLVDSLGHICYVKEHTFQPIKGSRYSKPAFAGAEMLLGIADGRLIFSHGVWFHHN